MKSIPKHLLSRVMPVVAAIACTWSLAGCERKEKIVDIKAPGVDIEVNKTKRGIEVETDRDKTVDIEAPGVDIEVRKDRK